MDFAGRRARLMTISSHLLLMWLREGTPAAVAIAGALPGDARILDARYEDQGSGQGVVHLYVESEEWEPIPVGGCPQVHDVYFRTLNPAYEMANPIGLAGIN